MGYDNIIIRRQWLIERIEWLYKNGKMSLDEYQRLKKDNWAVVIEKLDRMEGMLATKYPFSKDNKEVSK